LAEIIKKQFHFPLIPGNDCVHRKELPFFISLFTKNAPPVSMARQTQKAVNEVMYRKIQSESKANKE
jgi:hypothetical protein